MSQIHRADLTDLADVSSSKITSFLEELSSMWVKGEHLHLAAHRSDVLHEVSEVLTRGSAPRSLNERLARAVLGRRFFGVGEWEVYLQEEFSWEEVQQLPEFPWDINTLLGPCPFKPGKRVFETHSAFLGKPRSNQGPTTIINLRPIEYPQERWVMQENFATVTTLKPRWYLVHLWPVRRDRLTQEYEVPTAVETMAALAFSTIKGRADVSQEWQEFETSDTGTVTPPKGCTQQIAIRHLFSMIEFYLSQPEFGVAATRRLP